MVLNGVMWSVVMHFIFSNQVFNTVERDCSLYCFIGSPLHFSGPDAENVPMIIRPLSEIWFCAMLKYFSICFSVVKK